MARHTIYECDFCGKETRTGIEYNDLKAVSHGYIFRALQRVTRRTVTTLCLDCHDELEDKVRDVIDGMRENA